jgi:hypothetical protein
MQISSTFLFFLDEIDAKGELDPDAEKALSRLMTWPIPVSIRLAGDATKHGKVVAKVVSTCGSSAQYFKSEPTLSETMDGVTHIISKRLAGWTGWQDAAESALYQSVVALRDDKEEPIASCASCDALNRKMKLAASMAATLTNPAIGKKQRSENDAILGHLREALEVVSSSQPASASLLLDPDFEESGLYINTEASESMKNSLAGAMNIASEQAWPFESIQHVAQRVVRILTENK